MPRSKKRKHHHDYKPSPNAEKAKKNRSAVLIAIIFCGIIGMGIAFFAFDNALWMLAGAAIGAVVGYFAGKQLDRSFSKR
ncbi:MAG: hypothetical protein ABI666_04985 [Ferruginibacter sp.]